MKDRVFSGSDVSEAVALAAANLGLPLAQLRYVVLEAGNPGGRGLSPTPARIAVLLEDPRESDARRPPPAAYPSDRRPRAGEPRGEAREIEPRSGIRDTIRAIAEAGGLELSAEVSDGPEVMKVELTGADRGFFLEPDGSAEVLRATEHLLLRLYGAALMPRALRLSGEGFREQRDAALAAEARRLAEAVLNDGQPREMPSLNSYERRVVHMTLAEVPGITTASTGEGPTRRLTIAPAGGPEAGPKGDAAPE
jgi:predicted RNA-binding protein Jag